MTTANSRKTGELDGAIDYEAFLASGDPDFAWTMPRGRMGRDLAELHLRHHRQPERRRLPSSRRGTDGLRATSSPAA